jgi:hypothetical protein
VLLLLVLLLLLLLLCGLIGAVASLGFLQKARGHAVHRVCWLDNLVQGSSLSSPANKISSSLCQPGTCL